MTVAEYMSAAQCRAEVLAEPDRQIESAYTGDMLSLVMGRAGEHAVWFTIMNNINVAAVAHLTGCACAVLCEGAQPDAALLEKCRLQGINLLTNPLPAYECCVQYARLSGEV